MKKTIVSLLLAVSALGMFACDKEGGTAHTHVWEANSLNDGIMTYICTGCEETKEENKTALYKQTCDNIATAMNGLASTPAPTAKQVSKNVFLADGESAYVPAQPQDYIQVKGAAVFVEMLSRFIQNPAFKITSAPVKFTYSYARAGEQGYANLMYVFDEEQDKVTMHWDVHSTQGTSQVDIFLYLGVDYDFETNTVVAFEVFTEQTRTTIDSAYPQLISWLYEEETLQALNRGAGVTAIQAVQAKCDAYKAELTAKLSSVIDLQADFTTEYTAAMDKMNG